MFEKHTINNMHSSKIKKHQTARTFDLYPEIREMFKEFPKFKEEILPSRYWEELNAKNLEQLADSGFENFKRTVARNYFTWIVNPLNSQMRFLAKETGYLNSMKLFCQLIVRLKHEHLTKRQSFYYDILTHLLWSYVEKYDDEHLLEQLVEPSLGNPPTLTQNGRLISQDLANSILEYKAILQPEVNDSGLKTILELGPGYGRTAYVFLTLRPTLRYILVDIPPALYICQRYLTSIFPNRRAFKFRAFSSFENVREEFENSSLIFLTPNQIDLLPNKSIDLTLNISSLHEMRMVQIRHFFREIERLTRRYFYFKQWKKTTVPREGEIICEADYPIGPRWKLLKRQQCEIQHKFFERLYELPQN